jgi:lipopolysaccharide export system protein LptA
MKTAKLLIFLTGVLWTIGAMALSADRDQPAVIEADDVEFDFRTGVRTYRGNVSVVQGTLRIKSDKLVVNYKDGKMQNATAWGNPARFRQRPDGKKDDVIGIGKKILLNEVKNTLTLYTKASLKQGSDTAHGEIIIYDMAKDKLRVKGAASTTRAKKTDKGKDEKPTGRSRIVITPTKRSNN